MDECHECQQRQRQICNCEDSRFRNWIAQRGEEKSDDTGGNSHQTVPMPSHCCVTRAGTASRQAQAVAVEKYYCQAQQPTSPLRRSPAVGWTQECCKTEERTGHRLGRAIPHQERLGIGPSGDCVICCSNGRTICLPRNTGAPAQTNPLNMPSALDGVSCIVTGNPASSAAKMANQTAPDRPRSEMLIAA